MCHKFHIKPEVVPKRGLKLTDPKPVFYDSKKRNCVYIWTQNERNKRMLEKCVDL